MSSVAAEVLDAVPEIPELQELDGRIAALEKSERRSIMMVDEGSSDKAPVERLVRNLYVWAIINRCPDIHISGRGNRDNPTIHVNIRTPSGFRNFSFRYQKEGIARHWESKLFQLTGTPQGATTPDITSTRFDIALPVHFARGYSLNPFEDESAYNVDIRVEYIKTYNGFAFITRLLDSQRAPKLHELGLSYTLLKEILRTLGEPSGLILTTGPTGSGKTTLQNAMLAVLNDGSKAIHTIENPVEIALRGIGPIKQIQIGGNITYPRALRSALRSDPDVIMIGEIRDLETLDIALQAAATGHLVLATLHTNSAAEAYTRMLDLAPSDDRDAYAYRIAQSVKLVLAQRLLDRYEGSLETRPLTGHERHWLQANGIDSAPEIAEIIPQSKTSKVPLIEAIVTTPSIQRLLRADHVDVSEIYRAASDQYQFEPLAVGGFRAVQSHGSLLPEAIGALEGNMEARNHPSLRVRLAREHRLNFRQVADAIDEYSQALDHGGKAELQIFIEAQKAATLS